MAEDTEGFLSRWSRLKRSGGPDRPDDGAAATGPEDAAAGTPEPAATPAAGDAPEAPADAADLPPIESLTKDSDFSVFMRAGVPAELKRQALRKLWRSDPVFANLDGLLEYGEDFNLPFQTFKGKAIATLYRVGQGMPDPVKEIAAEENETESQNERAQKADAAASQMVTPADSAPADDPPASPDTAAEAGDGDPPPARPTTPTSSA